MKPSRKELAQEAITKALQMRARVGFSPWDPVCVFDLAEQIGVEVRYADIPSMEGVYGGLTNPTIIISSLRPPGRQAFTCGHELGHHALGHGARFDELVDLRTDVRRFDAKEFQADCFAGELLMPQSAVRRGFSIRSWDANCCSPENVYVVATWLGVGYATLVNQMWKGLKLLKPSRAKELLSQKPTTIRSRLIGRRCPENLIVADYHWSSRAIDAQVTDIILLPADVRIEGKCVELIERDRTGFFARAITPGIGRVAAESSTWSAYIRVSRQQYVGRASYRFIEEVGDAE